MSNDSAAAPAVDAAALRGALRGTRWRWVDVVAETGSTNSDLAQELRDGGEPGAVLIADLQTAGRGRHQRPWSAPAGTQLSISVSVPVPAAIVRRAGWLSLLAGVAAVRAVRRVTGIEAGLKWPNDLLLLPGGGPDGDCGGARAGKAAGILAELVNGPSGACAVIGMGLNVSLGVEQLPVPTATSLALAGAAAPDRGELAVQYLRELDSALREWEIDPVAALSAYREVCVTIGQQVTVALPDGAVLAGRARDVDVEGRIVVRTDTGAQALSAGDVTHLRPVT